MAYYRSRPTRVGFFFYKLDKPSTITNTVPFGENGKGTIRNVGQMAWPTVPFGKKRQRHGRNRRLWGVVDRAFWKKTLKARSKLEVVGHRRPCLLQKSGKGTVEIGGCGAQVTVPFGKKRQRHGRWAPASRIGAFGAGRSRPDGRRLVNKEGASPGRLL